MSRTVRTRLPRASAPLTAALLAAAACGSGGGGGGSAPLDGIEFVPGVLACRSLLTNPIGFTEIAIRSAQNLGTDRVAERTGIERRIRLHPDGNTIVYSRERVASDPDSRELFTGVVDGSRQELRLTLNTVLDDEPCWSPDGSAILFASERDGGRSLWLCDAEGRDPRPFLVPPAGASDGEPDWSAATDRVVFARTEPDGARRLWLVEGDGTGLVPLTDGGGPPRAELGDFDPAFAPDGATVVFVRRIAGAISRLCVADVATGELRTLHETKGELALPRWSPHADRVFFGLAEPLEGREPVRLAVLPAAGGTPVMVWPDDRYELLGLDLLPALEPASPALPPETLDVTEAFLEVAAGDTPGVADTSSLVAEDGDEIPLETRPSGHREVAGLNCIFLLPVEEATEILELRVRAVARVGRIGGDSALRLSIYNTVESRFDTAVEFEPRSTDPQVMTFTTSSLRHLSRQRQLRVTVMADLDRGERSELQIDLVEVTVVTRAPADS